MKGDAASRRKRESNSRSTSAPFLLKDLPREVWQDAFNTNLVRDELDRDCLQLKPRRRTGSDPSAEELTIQRHAAGMSSDNVPSPTKKLRLASPAPVSESEGDKEEYVKTSSEVFTALAELHRRDPGTWLESRVHSTRRRQS